MKQINTKYCYEFMKGFLYGLFFTIFFVSFKKRNINDIIDDEEEVKWNHAFEKTFYK